MTSVTSATVAVPGATLYYETQGSGPTLLVIPGGPQDAGVFTDLGRELADRYTVVAYDPRGNSRSTLEGPWEDQRVGLHADDAAHLLRTVGSGPAYVFGTSGGAQIGLDLAARYPELVRALVAHEPPCTMLLDDPAPVLASDQAIHDTYRRQGVEAAMGQFFGENDLEETAGAMPDFESMPAEAMETFERVSGNFEYFLAHGLLPLSTYVPDVDALKAGPVPVAVGIGEASTGQPIAAIGEALAGRLGIDPLPFPGDHVGFEQDPEAFAAALHRFYTSA